MKTENSLKNRLLALTLAVIMVLGMFPSHAIALEKTAVAQIGDITYDTLADAIAAVPTGVNQTAPAEATTIKLLQNTSYAFDVGTSTGATTMNLKLDLNGNTLTLTPSVGSVGTKSSGIRVLAYSKLEILNGTVLCSSEAADNVKVGIANYGTLTLRDVAVKKGDLTIYTINNRGALTLDGKTTINSGSVCAITNDPYDLYYTTNMNASVTCNSSEVAVESMLVERYARSSTNQGSVELNISAGYFGKITEDGNSAVSTSYNVTGGTIGVSTTSELGLALNMVKAGAQYTCPQTPVTIQLLNDMSGSFDVGISTGKAPKNIILDLNGKTMTLTPSVGSVGTKSNGIRVLAYSKLEIKNGTLVCSGEEADNVKVGIANYSDLTLDSVAVKSGDLTIYTINNRGTLTLKGSTSVENGKVAQTDYADSAEYIAITNDPYNLYYSSAINASINCDDGSVSVGNIQLETYGSQGNIELNITNGSFGGVYLPAAEGTVTVKGAISGGSFDTDVSNYCSEKHTAVLVDGKYQAQYIKDNQTDFGFAVPNTVEITFNDNGNKFTNPALNGRGTVTYSIASQKNVNGTEDNIAQIHTETGELTILKAGTVQVKAIDSGDAFYNPAEATYTLIILLDNQEGFGFAEPNPVDQWVGKPYTNTASGGMGTGAVTYAITEGADIADIDAATGELTFKKIGTVQVTATKAADDSYTQATISYIVKAIKYPQTEFKFANSNANITVGFADSSFTNPASGGSGEGAITYSIVSGNQNATIDEKNGKITFIQAGEVKVVATKASDALYNEASATYTLTIKKSEQVSLSFSNVPATMIYSPNAQAVIAVTGGSGTGKVIYSIISGNEYAVIDSQTGVITTLKAGGSITVQVDKAGDTGYEAAPAITTSIYIEYAEQENFAFETEAPAAVTFNDNGNRFVNVAGGGLSTGAVSYALADAASGEIADIDPVTGEITILAAGTIRVIATKAADDCYRQITATYSLTVEKDTPEFNVSDVALIYGATEHQLVVDTVLAGSGKYTYSIEGNNEIGASVDENGKVTFANSDGKVGSIIIKVKKEADTQYIAAEKTLTLTVSYHQPSAQPTVSGNTINDSGWYTGTVTIAAPEGYEIAYANDLTDTVWSDQVAVNSNGDNTKCVYLKKGNEISDGITFSSIKIDTAVPTNVNIEYKTPILEALFEHLLFGFYKAKTLNVTLTATDVTSGVDYFTYNLGEDDIVVQKADFTKDENGVAEYTFDIAAQYRNKITLQATDIAGWTTELTNSKHTLVVDTISPKLDVKYAFAGSQNMGDIIYTNKDLTVKFEIEEANFDLSLAAATGESAAPAPVLTVNGAAQELSWSQIAGTDKWEASYTLSGNGDYVLELSYTDRSTNTMETYTQEIHIDDLPPVIEVTYDNNDARNENNYNAPRTATIRITEHNFLPEEVDLSVIAKDITGAPVDISAKAYADYVKNPANWTQDGDTWTLTPTDMVFDIDAIYHITLGCTDLAEKRADSYVADFVIDRTAPTDVTITYSTSILDKLLEKTTFGFYQGDVQVTVSAKDQTAGVESFTISYNQVDGANNSNRPSYSTNPIAAVPDQADPSLFTATHTIPAQARGTVSVDLIDKAGNSAGQEDDYVVVADTIAPGLEYAYIFTNNQVNEHKGIYYTQGDVTVKFTIEEANFDLSLAAATDESAAPAPVLTVNGAAQELSWSQIAGTDKWEASYTLSGNGDYVLELSYTDRSTNTMETYTQEIHIDDLPPVIEVTYDNNDARNENNYNAPRTATIRITEHNFLPEEVVLSVIAQDITGAPVDISAKAYADYVKNPANWTQDGDTWTLTSTDIVFDIDAIYHITQGCTDLAENRADSYVADFVIDRTAPTDVTITYSTSILDKLLEKTTFGFYQGDVQVTVSAKDQTAGVESFTISYNQVDGANNSNRPSYSTNPIAAVPDQADPSLFTATHTIPAQARGTVSVDLIDKAGNSAGQEDDYVVVADTIAPGLEYAYIFTNNQVNEHKGIYYTQGDVTVKFTIEEANFDLSLAAATDESAAPAPVLTVNGAAQKLSWSQIAGTDKWEASYTLSGNGDYVLELAHTDLSANTMKTYKQIIHIDDLPPVIEVTYDNNDACNENNYNAPRTATIRITEHNFLPEEVVLSVIAQDITGAPVDISAKAYADYVKNPANWTQDGDTWTLTPTDMVFDIDAIYHITLSCTDLAQNKADTYANFVIDKTEPENITIEYSDHINFWQEFLEGITFGYYSYNKTLKVTLTADDLTSGVDSFTWHYIQEPGTSSENKADTHMVISKDAIRYSEDKKTATATFTMDPEARGYIAVDVTDRANNTGKESHNTRINVVDSISPTRTVSYEPEIIRDANYNVVTNFAEGDPVTLYYKESATVTFTVTEANFYADDVKITVNGTQIKPTDWTKNDGDSWTGTITIAGDGDYQVVMNYTDRSTNQMVEYKSPIIAIDHTAPVISVEYDNNNALNENNYKENRTATIQIIEHNFEPRDVDLTITAKDITGAPVDISSKAYANYAKNPINWTQDGDTWTLNTKGMVFDIDGIYTFDIAYSDRIGNPAENYPEETFVIDHKAPTDLQITYSQTVAQKIIEAVTFGFYQPDVTVTLTANDITSGVDYFIWLYTKEAGTSNINQDTTEQVIDTEAIKYSDDRKTATATFTIDAQARGHITARATDRAGNSDFLADVNRINVVDEIEPKVHVSYTAVEDTTSVHLTNAKHVPVDTLEEATQIFYNGNVTAKITITEANFFEGVKAQDGVINNVGILLTQTDDNGNTTQYEYLPEGAAQKHADATRQNITWTHNGDEHSFDIAYTENADYVLRIEYADHSSNKADITDSNNTTGAHSYVSKIITIDQTAPVISVEYHNNQVIHTIDNRDYFDAVQSATITVQEHNFRAEEFAAEVYALDIQNNPVKVQNAEGQDVDVATGIEEFLYDPSNWNTEGNTHTITVEFPTDANYSFDYTYSDLAQNAAADYENDLFTVDTTAPQNLQIVKYETSILEKIMNDITFGYYQAEMTVEISAEDDTSGVHYFVYSYIKSENVSDVNKELLNQRIEEANGRIQKVGNVFTTSFKVPEVLTEDHQFNGTVSFTAHDRSENTSTVLKDTRRLVVDNIAPTATISYNDPVQTVNNIAYYAGNINAKIDITEANFYSEDVVVSVTKDGASYPVDVSWNSSSTDFHTGTFTLTADGDYIVSVDYADRSSNAMTTYTSNRLTLDTTAPTVNVSNIQNNSANKDDVYGFTITANDINLDSASFKPVLTATVRNDDGSYENKIVSLGDMQTVEFGKTYTFTVENLEEDAVYSLVCDVQDMSGNKYSMLTLEDSQSYNNVRFSINRNGSTFAVDPDTDALVNQYYVYSVENDVVIEEINVDPVEIYTVTLNGQALVEGTDYTTTLSDNTDQWSKRTYRISKDLFSSEGEYSIIIESTDKTETTAYSDVKNLNVSFVVDQTAPVLTISGIENGGRYQVEQQVVTLIPTDDGGRLYSIQVVVLNADGEPIQDANGQDISVRLNLSGEELLNQLADNGGKLTFTIPEGLESQVQIICNDCAINADGITNQFQQSFSKVTVSQSQWIIFYANKPLFYGSIAGVILLIGGIFVLIFLLKKKKSAKK